MAGSWQEFVAKEVSAGRGEEDAESDVGGSMIGMVPGKKFVANTRIARRSAGMPSLDFYGSHACIPYMQYVPLPLICVPYTPERRSRHSSFAAPSLALL